MLSTHEERELRHTFENIMEDLDLYYLPEDSFPRVWAAFVTLKAQNWRDDTNFKVYSIRVEGRDVHVYSR